MKEFIKLFVPPVAGILYRKLFSRRPSKEIYKPTSASQELDLYWTEDMAQQLENWGKNHTWIEIEYLLVNCSGKVLDIACGTGVNIVCMSRFPQLDLYGFDISDFLIQKALKKGIDPKRLSVQNATSTNYLDNQFDFSYSIGSLEHFTEEGIELFLRECSRYTRNKSFHMIPVSQSERDEGWLRSNQSFHNNSVKWWLMRYRKYFREVFVLDSGYKDPGISLGKWFVCVK